MSRPDEPAFSSDIEEMLADPITWAEAREEIGQSLIAAVMDDDRLPVAGSSADVVTREKPVRAWVGAVAAVALIALVWAQTGTDPAAEPPSFSLVATSSDVDATARAGPAAAGWWIRLEAGGLAGAPEGTFYEGWVHDGVSWVSVGTFHMRDPGPVSLWSGVSLREFSHLVVTLESVDGDPAPSHDVVLEGRIPAQIVGG